MNHMKLIDLSEHDNKYDCHNYRVSIVDSLAQMKVQYSGLKLWEIQQRR